MSNNWIDRFAEKWSDTCEEKSNCSVRYFSGGSWRVRVKDISEASARDYAVMFSGSTKCPWSVFKRKEPIALYMRGREVKEEDVNEAQV